ncbi:MAG: sulfite exporter TauE/SafE family protein [Myxococcota bacterium]
MSEGDLIVVAIASLIGALVKSVTGMGYPLIAIPILTLWIGVESAVAVIALPNVVANALLAYGVRHTRSETRDLPVLVVTSVLGAIAGTFLLVEAPEEPLLFGLAASVFVFVMQRFLRPNLDIPAEFSARWSPLAGLLAGISHGAVGVSGPIVVMWLHGYRLSKDAYVFALTVVFLVAGMAQLAVLVWSGEFDQDRNVASLVALAATLCMVPVGTRLRSRLGGAAFERLILWILVGSGIALLYRALA